MGRWGKVFCNIRIIFQTKIPSMRSSLFISIRSSGSPSSFSVSEASRGSEADDAGDDAEDVDVFSQDCSTPPNDLSLSMIGHHHQWNTGQSKNPFGLHLPLDGLVVGQTWLHQGIFVSP